VIEAPKSSRIFQKKKDNYPFNFLQNKQGFHSCNLASEGSNLYQNQSTVSFTFTQAETYEFTSTGTSENITADDLTTLTFTFLPVEANTKELDLTISDVKFTKTAVEEQTIAKIETFENNFMAYPNPSKGNVNMLLFSEVDTQATVTLFDVTGKEIYVAKIQLTTGKNEIDFNVKVKPGVLFLKVNSKQVNYGTSKIIFR
jgi:hypothetical protein